MPAKKQKNSSTITILSGGKWAEKDRYGLAFYGQELDVKGEENYKKKKRVPDRPKKRTNLKTLKTRLMDNPSKNNRRRTELYPWCVRGKNCS